MDKPTLYKLEVKIVTTFDKIPYILDQIKESLKTDYYVEGKFLTIKDDESNHTSTGLFKIDRLEL